MLESGYAYILNSFSHFRYLSRFHLLHLQYSGTRGWRLDMRYLLFSWKYAYITQGCSKYQWYSTTSGDQIHCILIKTSGVVQEVFLVWLRERVATQEWKGNIPESKCWLLGLPNSQVVGKPAMVPQLPCWQPPAFRSNPFCRRKPSQDAACAGEHETKGD